MSFLEYDILCILVTYTPYLFRLKSLAYLNFAMNNTLNKINIFTKHTATALLFAGFRKYAPVLYRHLLE